MCRSRVEEAAREYSEAEMQKGQMDASEVAALRAHTEACRQCLAAREEKVRREAAATSAALAAEESSLAAESSRIDAEDASLTAKDRELLAKLEKAF